MGPAPKREMCAFRPGDVEAVGIGISAWIAIGGGDENVDGLTLVEGMARACFVDRADARQERRGRFIAQRLFDCRWPEGVIGVEFALLFAIEDEEVDKAADEVGRRIMAGDNEIDAKRERFVFAELLVGK